MRLHLGCGSIHIDGMANIDRRYQPGVDRVENIGILQHVAERSIDEIYACHALDHFDRWTYPMVLRRWAKLLKPGGALRISTPDFAWAVAQYSENGNLSALIGHLYAGQDYDDNVRHWCWDLKMARADLLEAGLSSIEIYDPAEYLGDRASDCSLFRDAKGRYRSLNVVGYKL